MSRRFEGQVGDAQTHPPEQHGRVSAHRLPTPLSCGFRPPPPPRARRDAVSEQPKPWLAFLPPETTIGATELNGLERIRRQSTYSLCVRVPLQERAGS